MTSGMTIGTWHFRLRSGRFGRMKDESEECSGGDAVRGRRVAAIVLLIVAGSALFGQFVSYNWWEFMMPLMGVGFVVWAALARISGLLVPGGIMLGIGAGQFLRHEFGSGAFLLAMAGGFLLIVALSRAIFGRQKGEWWPLFPAAGIGFAGLVQMAGSDLRMWVRAVQPYWPYAVIAVALYLWFAKPAEKKPPGGSPGAPDDSA